MLDLSSYQASLYKQLETLNYSVYDYIPTDAKFPFIAIGDIGFDSAEGHFNDLIDISQTINVWSDWEGKKEINNISSEIINHLLSIGEFQISDKQSVYKIFLEASTVKDTEGFYQAILNFKLTIKNK